ncbi:hypothetical protein DV515_00001430 [Chloebia gouldiae]|uniref:Uncharacterized protein n=1 Tax=Chloebia gouldiae TaxID=44316 RepID=A0A3L8SYG7_CHLGU|nr:hypothetical protein DV515_00001430 [Chloebia gouldiae]
MVMRSAYHETSQKWLNALKHCCGGKAEENQSRSKMQNVSSSGPWESKNWQRSIRIGHLIGKEMCENTQLSLQALVTPSVERRSNCYDFDLGNRLDYTDYLPAAGLYLEVSKASTWSWRKEQDRWDFLDRKSWVYHVKKKLEARQDNQGTSNDTRYQSEGYEGVHSITSHGQLMTKPGTTVTDDSEIILFEQSVDAIDYPAEEAPIQCFGHGISDICGFFHSVGTNNCFSSSHYTVRERGAHGGVPTETSAGQLSRHTWKNEGKLSSEQWLFPSKTALLKGDILILSCYNFLHRSPIHSVLHHGKQDNVSLSTKSINPTSTQLSRGFVFASSRSCLRSSFRLTESVAVLGSQKNVTHHISSETTAGMPLLCTILLIKTENQDTYTMSIFQGFHCENRHIEITLQCTLLYQSILIAIFCRLRTCNSIIPQGCIGVMIHIQTDYFRQKAHCNLKWHCKHFSFEVILCTRQGLCHLFFPPVPDLHSHRIHKDSTQDTDCSLFLRHDLMPSLYACCGNFTTFRTSNDRKVATQN